MFEFNSADIGHCQNCWSEFGMWFQTLNWNQDVLNWTNLWLKPPAKTVLEVWEGIQIYFFEPNWFWKETTLDFDKFLSCLIPLQFILPKDSLSKSRRQDCWLNLWKIFWHERAVLETLCRCHKYLISPKTITKVYYTEETVPKYLIICLTLLSLLPWTRKPGWCWTNEEEAPGKNQ